MGIQSAVNQAIGNASKLKVVKSLVDSDDAILKAAKSAIKEPNEMNKLPMVKRNKKSIKTKFESTPVDIGKIELTEQRRKERNMLREEQMKKLKQRIEAKKHIGEM